LNAARVELVRLCASDVREYDVECRQLIETVSQISNNLRDKLDNMLEPIQKDLLDCKKDRELAKQSKADSASAFARETSEARMRYREMEARENSLWKLICNAFSELEEATLEKKHFIWNRMLAKERHSRQQLIETELIKTQDDHITRLQLCEDHLTAAAHAAKQFQLKVDEFDAKLQNHVQNMYEELRALELHEASEYVRRYELFAFGGEEARAKKQTRLDAINLSKRNMLMDIEAASVTLDPNAARYQIEVEEIDKEIEVLTNYLTYLSELEAARGEEVEPWARLVAAHVAAEHKTHRKDIQGVSPHQGEEKDVRIDEEANSSDDDNDIPHPHIAAKQLGLIHEENVTVKAQDYVREELAAIENRMSDIRKTRAENEERLRSVSRNDNSRPGSSRVSEQSPRTTHRKLIETT
jgi:hypothetical protein